MRKLFLILLLIAPVLLAAQSSSWPGQYLKGYTKTLKGGGFGYHSPQPDVTTSMLLRSIDSAQFIAWETEKVPADYKGDRVNFIWIFGIDANVPGFSYKLTVNGRYCLTFYNPPASDPKPWKVEGVNGATLDFRTTMIDKYGDPMGYAILSLPVSMIEKGKPQVLKLVGESKDKRTWYMTFEAAVEEKLSIAQEPAVIRGKTGNMMPVLFQFVHLGEPVKGTMETAGCPKTDFTLETGFNTVRIMLPEDAPDGDHTATIHIEGRPDTTVHFAISPPRHLTIFLVQHTHTDIGYTRPQTEILPDHLRYIDYALDFCDLTDSLPDDARFRWTCETSWAVREYLRTRPTSQIERLKRRVSEGRIELTALFLNGSDLSDEATVAAMLQPVREIRAMGFPVKTAMQDDINGVPWCLTDYLPPAGIGYLNMGQNDHRALKPFDKPTAFWWVSPSGSRLLVNRPEHYMMGNSLGILSTRETFGKSLFRHLQDITAKGYNLDTYAIQFSGYLTDNSPPSTTACKLVKEWNEEYVWPKLRIATISEFFTGLARDHSKDLPVIRGAWPDWWMDGFGSAAIQTAYARQAHGDYLLNNGLMAIARLMGIPANDHLKASMEQVTDDIAFYDEHTFGAAESITDPLCENSVVQLGEKESYVWSAVKKNRILREEIMGEIQPFLPRTNVPTITVFNTLNRARNGTALVYADHQLIPRDRQFRIIDAYNRDVPVQSYSTREEGTWWMLDLKDVPPLGFLTCRIEVSDKPAESTPLPVWGGVGGGVTPLPVWGGAGGGVLENAFYRIDIDKTGKITRLYDKEWKRDLLDPKATYSLGEFIYERLGKNRGQLEQHRLDEYTRTTWKDVRIDPITTGPVYDMVTISGSVAGCAEGPVRCEIRLYRNRKMAEFSYSMKKLPVTDPEGVYISFPFKLYNGKHFVEVAGGTMEAGKDQVTGSATDWTGIQDFTALRSDSGQIVFSSPEIPLVQLGDINLGKFYRVPDPTLNPSPGSPTLNPSPHGEGLQIPPSPGGEGRRGEGAVPAQGLTPPSPGGEGGRGEGADQGGEYPSTGHIFSWVLNNYWTTNFLASQEGELKWSYQVTTGPDPSNAVAKEFGQEQRVPMVCRVFPAAVKPDTLFAPRMFFNNRAGTIALIAAKPSSSGNGVIFQLRETAGKDDSIAVSDVLSSGLTLDFATRAKTITEVNVLDEPSARIWPAFSENLKGYHPVYIRFRPWEVKFIRIEN